MRLLRMLANMAHASHFTYRIVFSSVMIIHLIKSTKKKNPPP